MNANQIGHLQRTVREDLLRFHKNLLDHIEDRELEESGVQLNFFWDNSQVQRAVRGALDLFDPAFNQDKFESKETLVACLAAHGWLGTIRMLEPHQAEFARALKRANARNEVWLTQEQKSTFLDAAQLHGDNQLSYLGRLGANQKRKVIDRYAGSADRLFKALQASSGPWRFRLSSMYESKVLQLSGSRSTQDYESIFGSESFRSLRDNLNFQRSSMTENNLADAVCLCVLQRQLEDYKQGRTRTLPRFYETSRTFRIALDRTGLLPSFSYRDGRGQEKTVLRDSDYFLFRAALTVRDERAPSSLANLDLIKLRELSDRIGYALDPDEPLRLEKLNDILVGQQSIQTIVQDLNKLWILERIWLPFFAAEDLSRLDQDERDRLKGLPHSAEVTNAVEAVVQEVQSELQANVNAYVGFRDLYRNLEIRVMSSRQHYERVASASERLYFVTGLVRFGIPEIYAEEIESLLGALLRGEGELSREEACAELVKMCQAAKRSRKASEKTVAFALLWALDYLDAILECALDLQEERWNIAIYAAAALSRNDTRQARRCMRELETRLADKQTDAETEALATTLAYLYYHLWREEGGIIRWRADRRSSTARTASELQELADLCLRYADTAYRAEPRETPAWLYALNILLFYLTEAGTDQHFRQAAALATELILHGNKPLMWQYRFDDTLARYFHRRTLLVGDPGARQTAWQSHKLYMKRAIESNPGNPEVILYAGLASNIDFSPNWEQTG